MDKFIKILSRPFCKHEKTTYVSTFLDDCGKGRYVTKHIWECKKCGKQMIGGGKRG